MFTSNPFAELSAFIPPIVMQTYVVIMILMVVGGTLFDIMHKKSAKYFFDNWRNAKNKGTRQIGGGEMVSLAIRTAAVEGLTSGEFCNAQRRIAHLLTMYGFVAYVVTTVIMVFAYPTPATPAPAILPTLWTIGALMVCLGGYWFWFFIRVDVTAEGNSPFRLCAPTCSSFRLCERDGGPVMGVCAGDGQHRVGKRVPGFVFPRHDGVIWINSVVQVLSYVLQARSGLPENGWRRRTVRATCRPPPTAPKYMAATADSRKIINQPILGLRYRR